MMDAAGIRGALLVPALACAVGGCAGSGATITVHTDSTFQTIVGWEGTTQSGEVEIPEFPRYAERLFDLVVDSLGITRLRMEAYSGIEHPVDSWSRWRDGALSDSSWRCQRYATGDDDGDPRSIDWSGFHFGQLDRKVEAVVLPIKRRLEARGERLYLNVTYVAFARQCPSTPYHHLDVDEYAEFALAVHLHLRDRYGLVPDGWEMILEPEHTAWRGRTIGEAMVRTAARLEEHGFRPEFIAPSNTAMSNAIEYFDEMIEVPGVLELLDEYSYHRYWNPSRAQARAIGERAQRHGLRTAMLEHIGSGHTDLHEDLVVAGVSAWQQFALAYGGRRPDRDQGGVYFRIDVSDPERPRIHWGQRTRYLRQYFHYVRPGAVRIGAASDSRAYDATAFRNATGATVVVVNAAQGGGVRIVSLPPGSYGTSYTTAEETADLPLTRVSAGDTLRAFIPSAGVLTVYGR
ncbi:MAG TPA: hypothetical protein VK922_19210 [Gemmatimonadaceae bacterium]|nr:hypothetical protein [Gemmatimonadaceae bacterium]